MATIKIDPASIAEAKAFYQEELQKALSRLNHIQHMLAELGESGMSIEINAPGVSSAKSKNVRKTSSTGRKRKAKPGPKSKWDKMLLKVLKEENKPFSYDELTLALMIASGRSVSEKKRTKATVQNTVFKLRNSSKVKTFSKGGRDKYIALSEWFDGDTIKEEYANKVPDHVKKTPKKVSSGRGPGRPRKVVAETKTTGTKAQKKSTPKKKAAPKVKASTKTAAKKTPTPVKKTAAKRSKATAKKSAVKKSAPAKKATKASASKTTRTAKKRTTDTSSSTKTKTAASAKATSASSVKKPATPKKTTAKKKTVKKASSAKKPTSSKKVAVRKTPDRGLSQVKGIKLPEPKK